MRVLHIGKFYPPFAGGMENFLADLLPALSHQGVTVAALVHATPRSSPTPDQEQANIPIYRVPCYGRLLYAPVSPSFPVWLQRTIADFQPDLLHLHVPNTSAFWALCLPAARRIPWVIQWQSDVVASQIDRRLALAYRLYRPFEQRLLAKSAAVIVASPPYLQASSALAAWHERSHVIPLGLDPQRIAAPDVGEQQQAERYWGSSRGLRVLSIGRLTYYKGQQVLIEAAAQLADSRILLVGSGEQRQALQKRIDSLQLQERVSLLGFQPTAVVNALLASCDVLCLPSLERTEAFGVVLLEAMRFAKPVVVSDIPGSGVGWVTRQAGHGLCVTPDDANALAAALRTMQSDVAQRHALGNAGKLALQEQFGIAPIAAAVQRLYRQLLD